MKKFIVKSLSAFLALVLILSALPMAVFAAEADASPCATCTHNYDVTEIHTPVPTSFTDAGHTVNVKDYYECTKCDYHYTVNRGTKTEAHNCIKKFAYTMVNIDGGIVDVYEYRCTRCNYKKLA